MRLDYTRYKRIIEGEYKMGRENNKGKLFSFDFWQKFGKTLMVVIAVMPDAGLMISLGKLIGMYSHHFLVAR